jgi:hypothetical protein
MMMMLLTLLPLTTRAQQKAASATAAAPSTAMESSQTAGKSVPASAPPSSAETPKKLVRGWLARIMPIGDDPKSIPSDELGRFIASKDSYRLGDFAKESSIRTGVDVGWKGEALLDVTEVGRHTFSMNFIQKGLTWGYTENLCWGSIIVEGQVVAQGQVAVVVHTTTEQDIKSIVGGADLEPGRYRVEFWTACGVNKNEVIAAAVKTEDLRTSLNIAFEVLVKRPGEAAPIPASKAFVLKLQNAPQAHKSP